MATIAMSLLRYLTLLVFGIITALGLAVECAMSAEAGQPRSEFTLSAKRGPEGGLMLAWSIAPGTYLYREQIAVSAAGRSIAAEIPAGETKDDPNFGPTEIYHRAVAAVVGAADLAGASTLSVKFQGCSERGICYPPRNASVDLATLAVTEAGPPTTAASASAPAAWTKAASGCSSEASCAACAPIAIIRAPPKLAHRGLGTCRDSGTRPSTCAARSPNVILADVICFHPPRTFASTRAAPIFRGPGRSSNRHC